MVKDVKFEGVILEGHVRTWIRGWDHPLIYIEPFMMSNPTHHHGDVDGATHKGYHH